MSFFIEITIGGMTKEQLLKNLSEANIQFNDYARTLFEHPDFTPVALSQKVKLAKVNLAELDLPDTCSFEEFSKQAALRGLKFCPLYLAAFLRLEYLDQPAGPYLTVATEKREDFPNGFYLRNNENALWLRGYKADGFDGWPHANEFIFIKE
jgi:hypothetical protein